MNNLKKLKYSNNNYIALIGYFLVTKFDNNVFDYYIYSCYQLTIINLKSRQISLKIETN